MRWRWGGYLMSVGGGGAGAGAAGARGVAELGNGHGGGGGDWSFECGRDSGREGFVGLAGSTTGIHRRWWFCFCSSHSRLHEGSGVSQADGSWWRGPGRLRRGGEGVPSANCQVPDGWIWIWTDLAVGSRRVEVRTRAWMAAGAGSAPHRSRPSWTYPCRYSVMRLPEEPVLDCKYLFFFLLRGSQIVIVWSSSVRENFWISLL
jgi:hypothetical protein